MELIFAFDMRIIMKKKTMRLYHCIYVKNNYQGKKDWNKSPSSQP